jgi:hypothetical protein
MRIVHGTVTFLCKVKSHRGESLNETVDDLSDLGRVIDPEQGVWTTRSRLSTMSGLSTFLRKTVIKKII